MGFRVLIACVALVAASLPGRAADLTIVVNRSDTAATIYIAVPAPQLAAVFGPEAEALLPTDDLAIDAALQQRLLDQADVLLTGIAFRTVPDEIRFQGMSMVLHPADTPAAFETPWDASLASSICTVPLDSRPWRKDNLLIYAGFVAHGIDGTAGFSLTFPETGRAPIDVILRDFVGGRPGDAVSLRLADGGSVQVAPTGATAVPWWAVAAAAAIITAAWALFGRPGIQVARRSLGRL